MGNVRTQTCVVHCVKVFNQARVSYTEKTEPISVLVKHIVHVFNADTVTVCGLSEMFA